MAIYEYYFQSVNDGNGFDTPIASYWPDGSTINFSDDLPLKMNYVGSWVKSPLSSNGANSYHVFIGPLNAGEQIVTSIKYVIQWEDGSWDVGIIMYVLFKTHRKVLEMSLSINLKMMWTLL